MPRSNKPTAESLYREAYQRGIRRAAPNVTFAVVGRIGSVLGPALRAHALDSDSLPICGEALLAWIEAEAYAFRVATDGRAQYWGGWSAWHFAKWLNERGAKHSPEPASRLQPMSGKKIG